MTHPADLDVVSDYAEATRALLRARDARNLTQEALAERLGISQTTVARHESGERIRSGEDLFAAAHVLGLDIALVARPAACPTCGQPGEPPVRLSELNHPARSLGELSRFVDSLIWAHGRVRRQSPDTPRFERITETANVALGHLDVGPLALVAADAIDRLVGNGEEAS